MDKHCKGCFYQVFDDTDRRKCWGFCGYQDIIKECKSKMNPDADLPNMSCYLKKQLKEMSNVKNSVPSCMFVQTCFDGKCPYYRNDGVKIDEDKPNIYRTGENDMGVYHEIKEGLTQAIEYEKGNLKAKETTLTTNNEDTLTQSTNHARWKKILQKDTYKYTCECSNCGFGKGMTFDIYKDPFCIDSFEYCPHCGFKMDATEVEIKDE